MTVQACCQPHQHGLLIHKLLAGCLFFRVNRGFVIHVELSFYQVKDFIDFSFVIYPGST